MNFLIIALCFFAVSNAYLAPFVLYVYKTFNQSVVYATIISNDHQVGYVNILPGDSDIIYGILYNQNYNATTMFFYEWVTKLFYGFNIFEPQVFNVSNTPLELNSTIYMTMTANGTVLVLDYGVNTLYTIDDLVNPELRLVWINNNGIVSIATKPNNNLYGATTTDGIVYRLDWFTGDIVAPLCGHCTTYPEHIFPTPQYWFLFDNLGTTLYLPVIQASSPTSSFIATCSLTSSNVTLTDEAASIYYLDGWQSIQAILFLEIEIPDVTTGITVTTGPIHTQSNQNAYYTVFPVVGLVIVVMFGMILSITIRNNAVIINKYK